jgi:predicted XRE-type DNA-binding protein
MMRSNTSVTRSSGNVFADLGFANSEEELFKARIVVSLRRMIENSGLNQTEAAERMGVSQPDVSKLLRQGRRLLAGAAVRIRARPRQ